MKTLMLIEMDYHTTVLLHEGIDALQVNPNGCYVDATLGAGGHSRVLLDRLGDAGRLIAFDQDQDAVKNAPDDERFELCQANFRFLKQFLLAKRAIPIDGLIADLGVSGHHFDEADRGFSFRFDSKLDMRMNVQQAKSASDVVAEYSIDDLRSIFKRYGESKFAHAVAKHIVNTRDERPILKTGDLVEAIGKVIPEFKLKAELPKIFQAIRIEVNDELGVLKDLLEQSVEVIKPGGRLVILSYHSLEDRMVKHFLRAGNFEDVQEKDLYGNVNRPFDPDGKVVVPSNEEIDRNPRARSAKMRVAVKR